MPFVECKSSCPFIECENNTSNPFSLLQDETFRAKTTLVKDTDSPEYDQRFKVDIVRGNRQFQRIFKRHGVKFEVFSRGYA